MRVETRLESTRRADKRAPRWRQSYATNYRSALVAITSRTNIVRGALMPYNALPAIGRRSRGLSHDTNALRAGTPPATSATARASLSISQLRFERLGAAEAGLIVFVHLAVVAGAERT